MSGENESVNTETGEVQERDSLVVIDTPPALSPAARGEIDVQIATARRFPRSIKSFKEQALAMATLDEETAAGCFYSLPRGGKTVEGPSARLAEIVLSAWGNIRADARVIEVGSRDIVAEGACWDLEKNVAVRVQVKRRITDRNGKRYNDDMIVVTGNAACAIALRNAVFKVVPGAYTKAVLAAARSVAIGDAKTLASRRAEMMAYFGKMGAPAEKVLATINRPSIEDVTLDDLATLKGLATAIRDGDTTVDEAFQPHPGAKASGLTAEVAGMPRPATIGSDVAEAAAKLNALRNSKQSAQDATSGAQARPEAVNTGGGSVQAPTPQKAPSGPRQSTKADGEAFLASLGLDAAKTTRRSKGGAAGVDITVTSSSKE